MKIKFKFGILLLALPTSIFAADLHLFNDTNEDSTTRIRGICSSTLLGEAGITRKHTSITPHVISGITIALACAGKKVCSGDVYMTANCTGPVVAHGTFDAHKGVSVTTTSARYNVVQVGPFELRMVYK